MSCAGTWHGMRWNVRVWLLLTSRVVVLVGGGDVTTILTNPLTPLIVAALVLHVSILELLDPLHNRA